MEADDTLVFGFCSREGLTKGRNNALHHQTNLKKWNDQNLHSLHRSKTDFMPIHLT